MSKTFRTREEMPINRVFRNRVMCPGCGRQKMLFSTKEQVERFLRYNADKIPHTGEFRIYYCTACGGWHFTSKAWRPSYESVVDNLISAMDFDKKSRKIKRKSYSDSLKEAS